MAAVIVPRYEVEGAAGKSADDLLLPEVLGFDPTALSYGFSGMHEFELTMS